MNAPVKMGRPSLFTEHLAEEICDRLSTGTPLTVICHDAHMPSDDTVRNWAVNNPELSRAIARARRVGYDRIAVRGQATLRGLGPELGGESTGDVIRDKAIADYDLKLLAKWDPKGYGDLRRVEMTGADGGAIQTEHRQVLDITQLDYEGREALRLALEASAAVGARNVTPSENSGDD